MKQSTLLGELIQLNESSKDNEFKPNELLQKRRFSELILVSESLLKWSDSV